MKWGQTRTKKSWHIRRLGTPSTTVVKALCGKVLVGEFVEAIKWGGKSCETCLKIDEMAEERQTAS